MTAVHPEAYSGFAEMLALAGVDPLARMTAIDLGGQNVNGTVHDQLPNTAVTTLDLENADIIADARYWVPDRAYDLVICTEVFEHVMDWRSVVRTAYLALRAGGTFVFTCASDGRPPHGATGAPAPAEGEWYANVAPYEIRAALAPFTSEHVAYRYPPGDAYGWARR